MSTVKEKLLKIKPIRYYAKGRNYFNDPFYINGKAKNDKEIRKTPSRTEIINYLISQLNRKISYLEIGVRNPAHNFDKINSSHKFSVDPGIEYKKNPVDFKLTSDDFFYKLQKNEILSSNIKFDIIFIDGLHLADQVDTDIINSMNFIKDDGFIILHDCNPPTEWHARTEYEYVNTPAGANWNGTTWKAFLKWRGTPSIQSCCIDSDWGVGILSKKQMIGKNLEKKNLFYEFKELEDNRTEYLNLISFEEFKNLIT